MKIVMGEPRYRNTMKVIPNIVLTGIPDLTIYSGLIKLKSDKCMHDII